MSTPLKNCPKCGEEKPIDSFAKNKSTKDGRQGWCRSCTSQNRAVNKEKEDDRKRAWRQANKEHVSDYDRRYKIDNQERLREYRAANSEQARESRRAYREKNRERISERERLYAATNRERRAAVERRYYASNKERIAERRAIYYQKNKDILTAYSRQYRSVHAEAYRQYNRDYYHKNKERLNSIEQRKRRAITTQRWAKENRAARRATKIRRRTRERNAGGFYSAADVERQYAAQRGKCYYCGCSVKDKYEIDHVVPLSRGGSSDPSNLVIACKTCNRSKGAKLPHEWPQGGRLL